KNKKIIVGVVTVIIVLLLSFVWVNQKYLYTPFTYPTGLSSKYPHYSFLDFKKPILIEGIRDDVDGERSFSNYVTEEKVIKNVINHFVEAIELEDFDQKRLEQASHSENSVYDVIVRRGDSWEGGNSRVYGPILIQFSFYEGADFFFIDNEYF